MSTTIHREDLKLYADFDRNGYVSASEQAEADEVFTQLDTNKDGGLNLEDHWDKSHQPAVQRLIAAAATAIGRADPQLPDDQDHAVAFSAAANSLVAVNTGNDPEALWQKSQALYNYGALLLNRGRPHAAAEAYYKSLQALEGMPEGSRPEEWQDWTYATSAMAYRANQVELTAKWRKTFDPVILDNLITVLEQLELHLEVTFVAETLREHTTLDEVSIAKRDAIRLRDQLGSHAP